MIPMPPVQRHLRAGLMAALFFILAVGGIAPARASAANGVCPLGDAKETDGYRRLALIIGIGQYANDAVPDLKGPPNDARRFYELLTGTGGYGFPKENVCLLLDEDATTARVKADFDQALVNRVKSAKDVAVVYYAGHGSQARDTNGDEPDSWDETLMLQDARTNGVHDLLDDDFNAMLARLDQKTPNITVILDSCNSGTAMRGAADTFVARYFKPDDSTAQPAAPAASGDGGGGWMPEELPGVVVFTAATDGTPALETDGRGIFTDAILRVLGKTGASPLTYAQAAREVPPLVAAESYQIPYFHGQLDKPVFGNTARSRPMSWEVIGVGPPLKRGGPPVPGIGKGAELRLYDGSTSGADTRDPGKAKATVVVDEMTGLNATAHVAAATAGASPPVPGDHAVLARPSDDVLKIKVRLRPAGEPGGIPATRSAALREAIGKNQEASSLVELTEHAGDFELSVDGNDHLVLRGPENTVRKTYGSDQNVPDNLWQHARQRALLHLEGEGGADFQDNATLQVQLVPAAKQSQCADGVWEQAAPNTEQTIPMCHSWNIEVKLSKEAPTPLLIGGVILSTDGSTFGFPSDGRKVQLKPGETTRFDAAHETFIGGLPLDVQDRVIVFGTKETNPVAWNLLTSTAATRAVGPPKTGLYRALDRYLQPGTRGVGMVEEGVEDTTWTLTSVPLRVEANQGFAKGTPHTDQPPKRREYTIAHFDVRPYLPDDPSSPLRKVLEQADALARASTTDGYSYKQHDWKEATDEANLKRGVDCSRAIWFAFTRAGLPYNHGNRYLTTAQMVGSDSPMRDEFDSCSDDPNRRLGDIQVYRDDQRGDGHVVMVIDPAKRIAWGSHGWDGNAKLLAVEPDTGVEYQLIKFKKDWERWDRGTMVEKACWRYRPFEHDATVTRGQGVAALADACNADKHCGR